MKLMMNMSKMSEKQSPISSVKEIFVISYSEEKFIIYLPLHRIAFWGNWKIVAELQGYFAHNIKINQLSEKTRRIIETISTIKEKEITKSQFKEFKPTSVTLFPTSDCNLACIYCYARGGEEQNYLKWEITRQAIEFVVQNALEKEQKEIRINFHGNGEPTLHWLLITNYKNNSIYYQN